MTTSQRGRTTPDGPASTVRGQQDGGTPAPGAPDVGCTACGRIDPDGGVLGWTLDSTVDGTRLCPACSRVHLDEIELRLPTGTW